MAYKNPNNAIPSDPPFDYDKQNSFLVKDPQLDTELDHIERALDETQDRLDLIQRADGALANESVHPAAVPETTRISLALDTEARVTAAEEARDEAQTAQIGSENARDKAEEWADNPEDVAVEAGQFSAKHHALKAAADSTQTGLDRVATGEDRVQTGLDRVATGEDVIATAADRVQTGLDRVATNADAIATAADRVQTGLDRVATNADAIATAADRVQTGLDRIATGEDVITTAADRVQTGLDRAATTAKLEDFQGRYYGPLASDPATDPNGDPPTTGDLYWSTAQNVLKVYDGAVWQLATATVEGVYDVTELTNVATQDTFALTYDAGLLQVLYNGVQLAQSDFTAVNGTSVTLASAVTSATDVITFIRWGAVTESTFLGTAATEDVTTSPADTTAGRLLKVGDFGLSGPGELPAAPSDLNTLVSAGVYRAHGAGGTNYPTPSGEFGIVQVLAQRTGQIIQMAALSSAANQNVITWVRGSNDGGVTWHPWQRSAAQILGTVAQSAGVPTGAIIERVNGGSNGDYVKFADGTLICQHTRTETVTLTAQGNVFSGESDNWTFPAAFQSIPWLIMSPQANTMFAGGIAATGTSAMRARLFGSTAVGAGNVSMRYLAIGRWF